MLTCLSNLSTEKRKLQSYIKFLKLFPVHNRGSDNIQKTPSPFSLSFSSSVPQPRHTYCRQKFSETENRIFHSVLSLQQMEMPISPRKWYLVNSGQHKHALISFGTFVSLLESQDGIGSPLPLIQRSVKEWAEAGSFLIQVSDSASTT